MTRFTADSLLAISDIIAFVTAMNRCATALRNRGTTVTLEPIDTTGGAFTVANPEFINRIEANLRLLLAAAARVGGNPQGIQPTRTWRGERRDWPRLDFNDANRWFDTITQIEGAM